MFTTKDNIKTLCILLTHCNYIFHIKLFGLFNGKTFSER